MNNSIYIKQIKFSNDTLDKFNKILDVRCQKEFSLDSIPTSINFPILDDNQREYVGKVYKNDIFEARNIGARIITKNISKYLSKKKLNKKDTILIYCWRGGLRSKSLYLVLKSIGYDVTLLENGYKGYRSFIIDFFSKTILKYNFQVLNGLTGSGKTYFINKLSKDFNVINLENLANHKGSILGKLPNKEQPSQKLFETKIWNELSKFDETNTKIWVESESRKIGKLSIPNNLFSKMTIGNIVTIKLPLETRIKFILKDYEYLTNDSNLLINLIEKIKKYIQKDEYSIIMNSINDNNFYNIVKNLLLYHYDKFYLRRNYYINKNIKEVKLNSINLNSYKVLLKEIR